MARRKKDFEEEVEEEAPRGRGKKKENQTWWKSLREETRHSILGIFFVLIGVVFLFAPFGKGGLVGDSTYHFFTYLFGVGYYLIPAILMLVSINFFRARENTFARPILIAALLFVFSGLGLLSIIHSDRIGGGVVGFGIEKLFATPFGEILASIFMLGLALISLLILFDTPLHFGILGRFFGKKDVPEESVSDVIIHGADEERFLTVKRDKKHSEEDSHDEEKTEEEDAAPEKEKEEKPRQQKPIPPQEVKPIGRDEIAAIAIRRMPHVTYTPPPIDLLSSDKGKAGYGDVKITSNIIKKTLENFGVDVEMDEVTIGPSVTRYALKPAEGTKLSRIVELQRELSYALAADPIRVEAPIPGKSLVGIEIPNTQKTMVGLASLLSDSEYAGNPNPLYVPLGKGIAGKGEYANIAKMPHVLVAGATGAGKSVTMHAIITSLLYRNSPQELRFIMVDPKRVELTLYNGIPHLLTPVITDAKKAILTLKWATKEMERRYETLESTSSRDIQSYHKNTLIPALKKLEGKSEEEKAKAEVPESMPYIVIIVDELADLMSLYPRELEGAIVRLAQMSRAVGIHLVIATQRPSVNVITGLIKANVPSRVALKVASQIDSRTILDQAGAEKLLGAGDMLYATADMPKPKRVQSAFVSENEVKSVVKWIKEHSDAPLDEINLTNGEKPGAGNVYGSIPEDALTEDDEEDELFGEAKATVVSSGKASTSFLQRKLGIGYSRAAKLMDILEEKGVIGPADGAKPREVLLKGDNPGGVVEP